VKDTYKKHALKALDMQAKPSNPLQHIFTADTLIQSTSKKFINHDAQRRCQELPILQKVRRTRERSRLREELVVRHP
jgi:hypothetical protein